MKIGEFLAAKAVTLCFLTMGALLFAIFMAFGGVETSFLWTMEALFALLVLGWLAGSFVRERARLRKWERIASGLTDKYLLGEVLPPPENALEKPYYDMMRIVSRSAIGLAEQAIRDKEEYCDYVESWIHEIKTPLTACSLILANDRDVRKLKRELKRADNLTESILYYARLRTAEKDMQIREVSAAAVMDEAVKSQMELLIAAGVSAEVTGDFAVYTDAKPLGFILKQLLINAAKYTPGCHVRMTAADGVITVEDNGIGIPEYELSRVTERGFTGTNGRRLGSSTGMGLYIVAGLCRQLGITLAIASEQGCFTRMSLSFDSLTKL